MITRRRVLLAVLALLLVGVGTIAWTLAGLPPVKYYLRYGLDPYCEPTGERVTYEGVEFVEIGPGISRMGSNRGAKGGDRLGRLSARLGLPWGTHPRLSDQMPVHWVEFQRGFWIATTEITNAQYERFQDGHERSERSEGDRTPVVCVSWVEARQFCAWLAEKSGRPIRLPSEAEWECACRAGNPRKFAFGDSSALLKDYAWYGENSGECAHQVATKTPNSWGLHDMHGNVWEWCEDTWHSNYVGAPDDGSAWTDTGEKQTPSTSDRVYRGGGWVARAIGCRSASRFWNAPEFENIYHGFRPAFSNPEPK